MSSIESGASKPFAHIGDALTKFGKQGGTLDKGVKSVKEHTQFAAKTAGSNLKAWADDTSKSVDSGNHSKNKSAVTKAKRDLFKSGGTKNDRFKNLGTLLKRGGRTAGHISLSIMASGIKTISLPQHADSKELRGLQNTRTLTRRAEASFEKPEKRSTLEKEDLSDIKEERKIINQHHLSDAETVIGLKNVGDNWRKETFKD